jgi:general secretion pathway protein C
MQFAGVIAVMFKKFATVLLHLTMLALVCAIGAYWAIRIMTPAPASAPPPQAGMALREADPVLAARMFGLVQAAPVQMALNVQAIGVFAAGPDSAAVLVVDGKPARVYLLNQEVANGAKLVAVRKDAVTIEQGGARRDIGLPVQEFLSVGGPPPAPGFSRDGNTLTAPTVAAGAQSPGTVPRPLPPRPSVSPPAFVPPPQPPQPEQPPPQPLSSPAQPQAFQAQPQPMAPSDGAQPENLIRRPMPNRPLSQ